MLVCVLYILVNQYSFLVSQKLLFYLFWSALEGGAIFSGLKTVSTIYSIAALWLHPKHTHVYTQERSPSRTSRSRTARTRRFGVCRAAEAWPLLNILPTTKTAGAVQIFVSKCVLSQSFSADDSWLHSIPFVFCFNAHILTIISAMAVTTTAAVSKSFTVLK